MSDRLDAALGGSTHAADAGLRGVRGRFGEDWEYRLARLPELVYDRMIGLYLDAGCSRDDAYRWATVDQVAAAATLARVRADRDAAIALVQGWADQEARDARMFAEIARRRALVSPQEGLLQPPGRHGDGRSPADGYQGATDPPNGAQIALQGFASHEGE